MPLVQKSVKSLGYEPTDERLIAEDIEQIITSVNALEGGGGSEYTETIVNISSAQILAMGTNPIVLLAPSGANTYYDIEKVIFEYTHVTTSYDDGLIGFLTFRQGDVLLCKLSSNVIYLTGNKGQRIYFGNNELESLSLNENFVLSTDTTENPTLGDGTLRVKIYHKTITFGA
jgi:hypothetical protein